MNKLSKMFRIAVISASLTLASSVGAQQAPLQDKPFAEHKIVLQLSDNDPHKQALVISVANNLLKYYDPDKVAIEVVAFGPGIDVLRSENPSRKQVESLIAQGVLRRVPEYRRHHRARDRPAARHHAGRNPGPGRRRADTVADRKRIYIGQAVTSSSLRASGSRECAPDAKLREAIRSHQGSSYVRP